MQIIHKIIKSSHSIAPKVNLPNGPLIKLDINVYSKVILENAESVFLGKANY